MALDTYKRNKARTKQMAIDWHTLLFFVPYWLVSAAVVFVLLMLASLFYMFTPLTQDSLPAISRSVFILAEIGLAILVGRVSGGPGMVSGGIFGLGYTLLVLIIGLISGGLSFFSLELLLILFTGILLGAFGGIVGKNSVSRHKHRRGYYTK